MTAKLMVVIAEPKQSSTSSVTTQKTALVEDSFQFADFASIISGSTAQSSSGVKGGSSLLKIAFLTDPSISSSIVNINTVASDLDHHGQGITAIKVCSIADTQLLASLLSNSADHSKKLSNSRQYLFSLAEVLIKQDTKKFIDNIDKFNISSLQHDKIIRLASLLLEKDPDAFVEKFEKFASSANSSFQSELAELFIRKFPEKFSENIDGYKGKFKIDDFNSWVRVLNVGAECFFFKNPIAFVGDMELYKKKFCLTFQTIGFFLEKLIDIDLQAFTNCMEKFDLSCIGQDVSYFITWHLMRTAPKVFAEHMKKLSLGVTNAGRCQLAMALLDKDSKIFAECLENFELEKMTSDYKLRAELGAALAQSDVKTFEKHIDKFGVEHRPQMIADILLDKAPEVFAKHYRKFHLYDEQAFSYLCKIIEKSPKAFWDNINEFDVDRMEGERLNKIISLLRRKDCNISLVLNFNKFFSYNDFFSFDKEGQGEPGFSFVKKLIAKAPFLFAFNIKEFNIFQMTQGQRKELGDILSQANIQGEIVENNNRFNMPKLTQKQKEALLQLLYEKDLNILKAKIETFQLEDQQLLVLLETYPAEIVECLDRKKFNFIPSLPFWHRYKLAELLFQAGASGFGKIAFASLVDFFGLDAHTVADYASKIFQKDPDSFVWNIEKFKLDSHSNFDYAKRLIQKDPELFKKSFEKFNVMGMAFWERYGLAELVFEKDYKIFISVMDKFNLDSETIARYASKIFQKDPVSLVLNIEKFQLDKKMLLEFSKILIQQKDPRSLWFLPMNIEKFQLDDKTLFEYAQILINVTPLTLGENIEKFNLDNTTLLEFAKILIKERLLKFSDFVDNDKFPIPTMTDSQRFEFAELLFQKFPLDVVLSIEELHLDEKSLSVIALKYLQSPKANISFFQNKFSFSIRLKVLLDYFASFLQIEIPKSFLKDERKAKLLLELLEKLYPLRDKSNILSKAFAYLKSGEIGSKVLLKRVSFLVCLIDLNEINKIGKAEVTDEKTVEQILTDRFSFLGLDKALLDKFIEKIDSSKLIALLTYLSKINSLPPYERDGMLDTYKNFILHFANGSLAAMRGESPHFKALKSKNQSQWFSDLLEKWISLQVRSEVSLDESSSSIVKTQSERFFEFLCDRLIDNSHIQKLDTLFPDLFNLLTKSQGLQAVSQNTLKRSEETRAALAKFKKLGKDARLKDSDPLAVEMKLIQACKEDKTYEGVLHKKLIDHKAIENFQELFPDLYSLLIKEQSYEQVEKSVEKRLKTALKISFKLKSTDPISIESKLIQACKMNDYAIIDELIGLIKQAVDIAEKEIAVAKVEHAIYNTKSTEERLKEVEIKKAGLQQFILDMEDFAKSCEKKDMGPKLTFTISDSLEDLLHLGSETGGCQNIQGSSDYNKCLLGYGDGKNNIFALRDGAGCMIARSVVRMLWNEKEGCLTMFVEPIYTLNPDPKIRRALEKKIVETAQTFIAEVDKGYKLKVQLAFSNKQDVGYKISNSTDCSLVSFGCIAPFEYCDSVNQNGPGITDGNYVVETAQFYNFK